MLNVAVTEKEVRKFCRNYEFHWEGFEVGSRLPASYLETAFAFTKMAEQIEQLNQRIQKLEAEAQKPSDDSIVLE